MLRIALILFILLGALCAYVYYRNQQSGAKGINNAQLSPCPGTPNCVSSDDPSSFAAPFDVAHLKAPLKTLTEILNSDPQAEIVLAKDNYIHAIYRSPTIGFIDDVEFLYIPDKNSIKVRSASRVGYSDLGINIERVETLRKKLAKAS